MSRGGWLTRAERDAQQQGDSPSQTPDAAPTATPKDLAALQRQGRSRRQRSSVAAVQREQRDRHQQELTRKAEREENLSRVRQLLANRWLRRGTVAVAAVLLAVLVVLPVGERLLDPPLSEQQLKDARKPIDAEAGRFLGSPFPSPTVKTAGPDEEFFVVRYDVSEGARLFRGGRVKAACWVQFEVDRDASKASKLVFGRVGGERCR